MPLLIASLFQLHLFTFAGEKVVYTGFNVRIFTSHGAD
jgi:hypothetical protein